MNRVLVVAEAGVNHNGSLDMAYKLVDAAVAAGADAVKFQAYRTDELCQPSAPQYAMLRDLELSPDGIANIRWYCADAGITFMASSFDIDSTNILHQLNVTMYKVPSGEIINLPYLRHMAANPWPIVLSTGMATLGEIETAIETIESAGNRDITLLHCVSAYPADPADINLRVLDTLCMAFAYPVGLSDHTMGMTVALAAVARGAVMIEKHLTLDRTQAGPDHAASLEPDEFAEMVRQIRIVESALGDGRKRIIAAERETAGIARRNPRTGKRE